MFGGSVKTTRRPTKKCQCADFAREVIYGLVEDFSQRKEHCRRREVIYTTIKDVPQSEKSHAFGESVHGLVEFVLESKVRNVGRKVSATDMIIEM